MSALLSAFRVGAATLPNRFLATAALSPPSGVSSLVQLAVASRSSLHTSSVACSRIKRTHTHKPFWHVKKTAKQQDDPITLTNKKFIEEVTRQTFVNTRTSAAVGENIQPGLQLTSSPLKSDLAPWPRGEWSQKTTRCGLIGRKIGVVPLWLKNGKKVNATMIQIEDNHVIRHITREEFSRTVVGEKRLRPSTMPKERHRPVSYGCLVVGALSADPAKFTKDYCGLFTESGIMPKKKLARFPVSDNALIQPGTPLFASHFMPGQYVDIRGRTIRRGFQGVMKRWGFAGGSDDARGNTKSHRRPGCIGSGRDKSKVWPGKKLPGHMGGLFIRQRGIRVLRINYEHNILYLHTNNIPGEVGEFVYVFDTKLPHKLFTSSPRFFPTCYSEDQEKLPEEEYCDAVHKFEDPSITFK